MNMVLVIQSFNVKNEQKHVLLNKLHVCVLLHGYKMSMLCLRINIIMSIPNLHLITFVDYGC